MVDLLPDSAPFIELKMVSNLVERNPGKVGDLRILLDKGLMRILGASEEENDFFLNV